jgi:hypothetical protein
MADVSSCIDQAGLDILLLQPGIAFEDRLGRVSSRQHAQDMINGQPPTADDGLAAEDLWDWS